MKKKTQGAPAPNYVKWLWYAALTPFVLLAAMLTLTALGAFGRMPSFEELENPRSNIATEIYSEEEDEAPSPAREDHDHISSTALTTKERLEQLQTLKEAGLLTDEEYRNKREEILKGL